MRGRGHSGQVENEQPEKEHDPQQGCSPTELYLTSDRKGGGDESNTHKICPEQVSRIPGRHQGGHETCV